MSVEATAPAREGRTWERLMGVKRAEAMVIALGIVGVAGCSREEEPTGSEPPSAPTTLGGSFRADGPGDLTSIDFYDASHYVLRRANCPSTDDGCVVQGTFHVDASGKSVLLQDDGASSTVTMTLDVPQASSIRALAADPTLVDKGPQHLLTPYGCQLLARIVLNGQEMTPDQDAAMFENAVKAQTTGAQLPVQDAPDWVMNALTGAQDTCRTTEWRGRTIPLHPGSVNWDGIDLIDIPSCANGDADPPMNHRLYLRDGTPIAQYDAIPKRPNPHTMTYLIPPSQIRELAQDACNGTTSAHQSGLGGGA
jgi:hypothetical protein